MAYSGIRKMLKGNLADLSLLEILQTLAMGSEGRLAIHAPGVEGTVGFAGRRITYAEALGLSGLDALVLIAGLRQGEFAFAAEPPPEGNVQAPLEAVLTELASAVDAWQRLTHLPDDWSRTLRQAPGQREVELSLEELHLFAEAEHKTIAELLAEPGQVLKRAQLLDRMLKDRILLAAPPKGLEPTLLLALPYYGPPSPVAYVDLTLYQNWARQLSGPFKLKVRTPRGQEGVFPVEPREHIPNRLMLHDRELRKLRVGRGTKLKVMPEVEHGPAKP